VNIYLYKNNEQFGPYSLEQVQAFIDTGSFSPIDSVWFEGCEEWTTISHVPGVAFSEEKLRQHLVPPFEAYTGGKPYAFVSYAHADGELVFREIRKLNEAGYRIWYDEGIEPGNDWPEHIAKAVIDCSLFLMFTSPRSVASENCRNEVNLALNRKKKFLAVYLEETELPPGLELRMGDLQAILKFRMPDATYRKKVFAGMEKMLGQGGRDLPEGKDPVEIAMARKTEGERLKVPVSRQKKRIHSSKFVSARKSNLPTLRQAVRQGMSATGVSRARAGPKGKKLLWITLFGASLAALAICLAFFSNSESTDPLGINDPVKPTATDEMYGGDGLKSFDSTELSLSPVAPLPSIFQRRFDQIGKDSRVHLAVKRTLVWLKGRQAADGSWGGLYGVNKNAMTGLGLLCFLSQGTTFDSPDYGGTARAALQFLTSTPAVPKQKKHPIEYSHPMRTHALCEVYALTNNTKLKDFVIPAVMAIINGQHEGGGWAYGYGKGKKAHVDLSVTSWNVQALRIAVATGLQFDGIEQAMGKATAYVKRCQDATGKFAYLEGSGGKASLTGAGVYCLAIGGGGSPREATKGLDWIVGNQANDWKSVNPYALYYNAHACLQSSVMPKGKKYADNWKAGSQRIVIEAQRPDGSWAEGSHFHGDTDILRTLLATLALQAEYRYANAN
jgi:hypothetical protein